MEFEQQPREDSSAQVGEMKLMEPAPENNSTGLPLLRVNGQHLVEGFRLVAKVKGLGRNSAVISVEAANVVVTFGDLRFRAEASGDWPGTASIKGPEIRRIAKMFPPTAGTLYFRIVGDQLQLAGDLEHPGIVCPCQWMPSPPSARDGS